MGGYTRPLYEETVLHDSQVAKRVKNLGWMKVTVPTKSLEIWMMRWAVMTVCEAQLHMMLHNDP